MGTLFFLLPRSGNSPRRFRPRTRLACWALFGLLLPNQARAISPDDYVQGAIGLLQRNEPIRITMMQYAGGLIAWREFSLTWNSGVFSAKALPSGPTFTGTNGAVGSGQFSLAGVTATLSANGGQPVLTNDTLGLVAKVTGWPYTFLGSMDEDYYADLTPSRVAAGTFNGPNFGCSTQTLQCLYHTYFEGTLAGWVNVYGANMPASQLASLMTSLYDQVEPSLESLYPGLSAEAYKGFMIQNLVNGFYQYGLGPIDVQPLSVLLASSMGSCGTFQELVRQLGGLMNLTIWDLTLDTDYIPSAGHGREYFGAQVTSTLSDGSKLITYQPAVHALNLIEDQDGYYFTLDAQTNLSVALGQGSPTANIQASTSVPFDRFRALRKYGFWDYYMQPEVRSASLSADGMDASLTNMAYSYYFEAFNCPIGGAPPCALASTATEIHTNQWVVSSGTMATNHPLP